MAKILVVDDEKDTLELVSILLQKDAHQVFQASSGAACLDFLQSNQPDLILMDVTMPEMDGYTLVTNLAADDTTRSVPVIVLTGKDGMREAFQMFTNVVDFLAKPFDAKNLRERVRLALEKKPAF